jgi:molecular chaperone DnaK
MPYRLGVDLGTTYTAAAIARDGRVEPVSLGHSTAVPSVVFLADDGGVVIGRAAQLHAASDPSRVVREFKRRVGDPVPILVGGSPVPAEQLMARILEWVVAQVATAEGEPPRTLAVTHPANWGGYKRELLQHAIRAVPLQVDHLVPEPVAAATFYAARRELSLGTVVAVYDLGGGTFDAAVVRSEPEGFRIIGRPDGVERLGGIDFDHAVLRHVARAAGVELDALDPDPATDPALTLAVTRLRQECVAAKEALSTETEVAVPVILPDRYREVRLTRVELEAMIRPALHETLVALRRAIASAGLDLADVTAVLLVGGSSRIPLAAQLVTAELGRPVAVDARPKDATSLGAALLAEQAATAAAAVPLGPLAAALSPEATTPTGGPPCHAPLDPAPASSPAPAARLGPRPRRRRPVRAAVAAGIALVGVLAGALVLRPTTRGEAGGQADPELSGTGTTAADAPVDMPDPPTTPVAVGLSHACALAPGDGATAAAVACWGDDDRDQASPPGGQLDTIAAGYDFTCGIRFDRASEQEDGEGDDEGDDVPAGRLSCWGGGEMEPAARPAQQEFFAVSVSHHGCAIAAGEPAPDRAPSNDVPSGPVTCWGRDDQGQATVPESTELGGAPAPIGNEYSAISAGGHHTCGLNAVPGEGDLAVCWGDDLFGQASPPEQDPNTPKQLFSSISAGFRHTCGLHTDGTVTCWGDDTSGEASPPDEPFRAISTGGGFTCGIRTDGSVACWGSEDVLEEVPAGQFTSISSGDSSACGVRTDDTVVCWGIGPATDEAPPGA